MNKVAVPSLLIVGLILFTTSIGCNPHSVPLPEGYETVRFDMTTTDLRQQRSVESRNDQVFSEPCPPGWPCDEVIYKFEEDRDAILRLITIRFGPSFDNSQPISDEVRCGQLQALADELYELPSRIDEKGSREYRLENGYAAILTCRPFPALWVGFSERLEALLVD